MFKQPFKICSFWSSRFLWPVSWGPTYNISYSICILMSTVSITMCFIFRSHLSWLNHKAGKLETKRGDTVGYRYILWYLLRRKTRQCDNKDLIRWCSVNNHPSVSMSVRTTRVTDRLELCSSSRLVKPEKSANGFLYDLPFLPPSMLSFSNWGRIPDPVGFFIRAAHRHRTIWFTAPVIRYGTVAVSLSPHTCTVRYRYGQLLRRP